MPAGRPTDYNPKYCKELVEHMSQGLSFEAFAGYLGISKQTLYNWAEKFPEFMDAKDEGFQKSRLFWETVGVDLAKTGTGNATAFVFNMKNRFPSEWRDKQEIDQNLNGRLEIVQDFGDGDTL